MVVGVVVPRAISEFRVHLTAELLRDLGSSAAPFTSTLHSQCLCIRSFQRPYQMLLPVQLLWAVAEVTLVSSGTEKGLFRQCPAAPPWRRVRNSSLRGRRSVGRKCSLASGCPSPTPSASSRPLHGSRGS